MSCFRKQKGAIYKYLLIKTPTGIIQHKFRREMHSNEKTTGGFRIKLNILLVNVGVNSPRCLSCKMSILSCILSHQRSVDFSRSDSLERLQLWYFCAYFRVRRIKNDFGIIACF